MPAEAYCYQQIWQIYLRPRALHHQEAQHLRAHPTRQRPGEVVYDVAHSGPAAAPAAAPVAAASPPGAPHFILPFFRLRRIRLAYSNLCQTQRPCQSTFLTFLGPTKFAQPNCAKPSACKISYSTQQQPLILFTSTNATLGK